MAIPVATSIAPGTRLEVQAEAVASWMGLGFRVLSFNAPDEIAALAPHFEGVEFVEMARNGRLLAGKPVVYVSDMLTGLKALEAPVAGIVNSDIFLAADSRFPDFIAEHTAGGFLYAPRFQVAHFQATEGTLDPLGYDLFFFDRALIVDWGESRFCLGMPFWDHWFPLMPILAGRPTVKLVSPTIRHIPHETVRDDSFFMFNDEYVRYLIQRITADADNAGRWQAFGLGYFAETHARLKAQADDGSANEAERMRRLERLAEFYDSFTRYVVLFLDRNSQRLDYPG